MISIITNGKLKKPKMDRETELQSFKKNYNLLVS